MADSFVNIVGDGVTTIFSIPFDYLDNTHVTALVDSVATPITFPTVGQAEFAVAPVNGATGRISRSTPRDTREVVWQNAANLSAGDLNTSDLQLLFIAQESFDAVVNTAQDAIDAELSATAAATSASNAALSEAQTASTLALVQAIYDDFDDAYLGAKASDPTVDNDGDALNSGDLYYNTVAANLRIYDADTTSWLILDLQLTDNSVSNAKLQDMAVNTIKGRVTAGTGDPEDLSGTEVAAIIGDATTNQAGVVTLATASQMSSGLNSRVPAANQVKFYVDNEVVEAKALSATAVATTSGTTIDFGSLPSGIKEIKVCFSSVRLNSTDDILVQLGDSGGVETSSYVSTSTLTSTGVNTLTATNGFVVNTAGTSGLIIHGVMTLVLLDSATNTWSASYSFGREGASGAIYGGGSKSLSGELTTVRLTSAGGANSYNGGTANITYYK